MHKYIFVNGKELSVFPQTYTVHHENYHAISYKGYPIIEIENEKIADAIREIEVTGKYNGFSFVDAIQEVDKKEDVRLQKICEKWDKIHEEIKKKEAEKEKRKKKIVEYVDTILSKKYPFCRLVYNMLDENIEKYGTFTIHYSGRWINIPVSEAL